MYVYSSFCGLVFYRVFYSKLEQPAPARPLVRDVKVFRPDWSWSLSGDQSFGLGFGFGLEAKTFDISLDIEAKILASTSMV